MIDLLAVRKAELFTGPEADGRIDASGVCTTVHALPLNNHQCFFPHHLFLLPSSSSSLINRGLHHSLCCIIISIQAALVLEFNPTSEEERGFAMDNTTCHRGDNSASNRGDNTTGHQAENMTGNQTSNGQAPRLPKGFVSVSHPPEGAVCVSMPPGWTYDDVLARIASNKENLAEIELAKLTAKNTEFNKHIKCKSAVFHSGSSLRFMLINILKQDSFPTIVTARGQAEQIEGC